jgi:bifunctional UDP-N-acetylglucosamine pyrophosphorylase/glucosamine-1-phosphate N-acetyltransferase
VLIVPAAGLGTRLRTTLPKVLVRVNGRPMLDWLLDLYRGVVDRAIIVVHPSAADQIRAYGGTTDARLEYQVQEAPTGMLDAILCATRTVASSDASRILITWCDQVAVHPQTVERLTTLSDTHPAAALVMPTARQSDPYIHLERDRSDRIVRVLHRREGESLPAVGESDMGLFSLSRDAFLKRLPSYAAAAGTGGATGERNFLPFIPWIAARGEVVTTFPCVDAIEAVGVNTPEELQRVESYLAARSMET